MNGTLEVGAKHVDMPSIHDDGACVSEAIVLENRDCTLKIDDKLVDLSITTVSPKVDIVHLNEVIEGSNAVDVLHVYSYCLEVVDS